MTRRLAQNSWWVSEVLVATLNKSVLPPRMGGHHGSMVQLAARKKRGGTRRREDKRGTRN